MATSSDVAYQHMTTKQCGKCHEHKPLQDFHKKCDTKDGLTKNCKACRSAWNTTPSRIKSNRTSYLKRLYGITMERYDAMFALQNGGCAICHEPPPEGKPLYVDHDHKSGAVRALLCMNCNVVLGHAFESAAILHRCADYLTAHSEQQENA